MTRRILFITQTPPDHVRGIDPSVRYRCFHPAEHLARCGVQARVVGLDALDPDTPPDGDVYVFHRPAYDAGLRALVDALQSSGRRVLADQDGHDFDVSLAMGSTIGGMPVHTREHALKTISERAAALRLFRQVTVPNEDVARRVRALHPGARVSLVHDVPSLAGLGLARALMRNPPDARRPGRIACIGGPPEQADMLAPIAEPLARALADHDGELLVLGGVTIPPAVRATGRARAVPATNALRTLCLLRTCGTVLAPSTDPETTGTHAWRAFLEGSLAGCRFVGTASPALDRCAGFGARLVQEHDEWPEALSDALTRPGEPDGHLINHLAKRFPGSREARRLLVAAQ